MKNIKLFGATALLGLTFGFATMTQAAEVEVKSGDTLSQLAEAHNSTIEDLVAINGIQDANLIHVGQKLFTTYEEMGMVAQAPVAAEQTYVEPVYEEAYVAPVQETYSYSGSSSSAKEWIAQKESNGDYGASNGYHVGRYQLDPNYLNGDHSPENQERVADQYVADRYGSWENAQVFWMNNGWY